MLNNILVIDNKEYLVSLSCEHNNLMYYFLINITDKDDFKYCYEKDGKFMEVLDSNKVSEIAQLFLKKIINKIN